MTSTNLRIRSLSIHANYRCGHSGMCCTSGWPIPVERATAERLGDAVRSGVLRLDDNTDGTRAERRPVLTQVDGAPAETPVVTATDDHGGCVFYEASRRRCAIHRQLGEALLPDTCRQFPRVSLLDRRGLSVTVSHCCPTAANALFAGNTLQIVEAPPAFPATFPFDPLDAREALPPLLHPTVLLDLETFDRWEETAVTLLAEHGGSPEHALQVVSEVTETLRRWQPGKQQALEALADATAQAGERVGQHDDPEPVMDAERAVACYDLVCRSIPDAYRPPRIDAERLAYHDARFVAASWPIHATPLRHYAAAKIFASWLTYQGRGLRTIVFGASVALALVRLHAALECERDAKRLDQSAIIQAVRKTDELLMHLASRQVLADEFSRVEASLAAPGPLGLL